MMKIIKATITILFGVLNVLSAQLWIENFQETGDLPTDSYGDAIFVSSTNSLTWSVVQGRQHTQVLNQSLFLKGGEGVAYLQSPVISGGLSKLSFSQHRGFASTVARTFILEVTDEDNHSTQTFNFSRSGAVETDTVYVIDELDIDGSFSFRITNTTSSTAVVIDEIKCLVPNANQEDFEKLETADSYDDGTFEAYDGSEWKYTQAFWRSDRTINGSRYLMLNSQGEGSVTSSVIRGGVSKLYFSIRQAYTGTDRAGDRSITIEIWNHNETLLLQAYERIYTAVSSSPTPIAYYDIEDLGVHSGCKIKFINSTDNNYRELMIDDIYWEVNPIAEAGISPHCFQIEYAGTEDANSQFSYYHTSPESPDGSRICYIKYTATLDTSANKIPAELWTVNKELTQHEKIIDIDRCELHNGASAHWVNDSLIAYINNYNDLRIVNVNTKARTVSYYGNKIGHDAHNNCVLYSNEDGLYELDCLTLTSHQIIAMDTLFQFNDVHGWEISTDGWKIYHPAYSPNGAQIVFRLENEYAHNGFVIINRNGTNYQYLGVKPLHFNWYDNETIFGHDTEVDDGEPNDKSLRRWDTSLNYIETLAPGGNHAAMSPDRQYSATETWYDQMPVVLTLHEGKDEIWSDVVSTDSYLTWDKSIHVNPSFSRDGKTLYFNQSPKNGVVRACRMRFICDTTILSNFKKTGTNVNFSDLNDIQIHGRKGEVYLNNSSLIKVSYKIIDIYGRVILTDSLGLHFKTIPLDVGIYIVAIINEGKLKGNKKIIVY